MMVPFLASLPVRLKNSNQLWKQALPECEDTLLLEGKFKVKPGLPQQSTSQVLLKFIPVFHQRTFSKKTYPFL